jgi:hypothetical protein
MKKLFFASVFALATLTACNNSEPGSMPEESQQQTFQSKTTAREGETTDEKEESQQAIEIIKKDMELSGGSDSRILCHTPYSNYHGHACVTSGGYLFNVEWSAGHGDLYQVDPDTGGVWLSWTSTHVNSCNCR